MCICSLAVSEDTDVKTAGGGAFIIRMDGQTQRIQLVSADRIQVR